MAGQEKQWGVITMNPMVLILHRTRSLGGWERHLEDLAHIYLYSGVYSI